MLFSKIQTSPLQPFLLIQQPKTRPATR